jgi:hypothetical protein
MDVALRTPSLYACCALKEHPPAPAQPTQTVNPFSSCLCFAYLHTWMALAGCPAHLRGAQRSLRRMRQVPGGLWPGRVRVC